MLLVPFASFVQNIVGEVYEVNDALLADLDELEGYPGYYDRKLVSIKMEKKTEGVDSPDVMDCWLYMLNNYKPFMRDLEKYENYDSYGSHGKPYVSRCDREEGWVQGIALSYLSDIDDNVKARFDLK